MIFLDYDVVSFNVPSGNQNVYTATYTSMIQLFVSQYDGRLSANATVGIVNALGNRNILDSNVTSGNETMIGSMVIQPGDVINAAYSGTSALIGTLHIFRLPELK